MRPIPTLLASFLTLSAVPPGALAGETIREQSEARVSASGISRIRIENAKGSVEVRPSADGAIHLKALKTARAQTERRARELADECSVETQSLGGVWSATVRYPARQSIRVSLPQIFGGFELPSCSVRLLLEIPSRMTVSVQSSSGDVLCERLAGEQKLQSSSGDVTVLDAAGRCELSSSSGDLRVRASGAVRSRTSSGDIVIERAGGPAEARTASGDVSVENAADSLVVESSSGDVRIARASRGLTLESSSGAVRVGSVSGSVSVSSGSGDVLVALAAPLTRARLSTSSGGLTVKLGSGLGVNLNALTSSGTIESDLPMEVNDVSRHRVAGRIGGGGANLDLKSASGHIRILTGGK
jgi:DUF4097 and DUF4098 domain-containing protein YvlB